MIWEYKTIKLAATGFWSGPNIELEKLDMLMNELGQQGWELVTALDTNQHQGTTKDIIVIFKRPRN